MAPKIVFRIMQFKVPIHIGLTRLLFLLLFSQACASVSLMEKQQSLCPKCKDPHRYVLTHGWPGTQQNSQIQIAHPFNLSVQDWTRVLSSIHVQNTNAGFFFMPTKGDMTQAFTSEEIDFLSAALSKSFAQANPSQVLVFGVSRVKSNNLIEVTTGGWYVEGNHIHLLLANYRQSVTMPNVLERLWRNPLSVNVPPVFEIVPGGHQKLGVAAKALGGLMKSDIPDLSIDFKALLATEPSSPIVVPDNKDSSIEQRLQTLTRLKEKGLITEKEFLEKKKKLIEGL